MTKYYAVFDTNVIVSALLTSHPDSPTATLLNMVMDGVITPVFNEEILNEYTDTLIYPIATSKAHAIRRKRRCFTPGRLTESVQVSE